MTQPSLETENFNICHNVLFLLERKISNAFCVLQTHHSLMLTDEKYRPNPNLNPSQDIVLSQIFYGSVLCHQPSGRDAWLMISGQGSKLLRINHFNLSLGM